MRPFGKTYLIKCENEDYVTNEGGIFLLNNTDKVTDGFWKGEIVEYGAGWSEDEIKMLEPIGTKVVMSYGKQTSDKGGVKVILNNTVYYIRAFNEILGVLDNE